MARTLKSDKILFLAALVLVCASVVMVYSASAVQAMAKYQASYFFLYKQLAWAIIGVGLMFGVMHVDYRVYRRPRLIWMLLGVTVVLLIGVFFFGERNNTQRWITLGVASIQPSELAKLASILFTAALLERRMHRVNEPAYALVPIGAVTFVLACLILREPDFGTTAVLIAIVAAMVFAAGVSWRYIAGAVLVLAPTAAALVLSSPYRRERLLTFMDPWKDPLGNGFQIIHSLFAIGSGGVLGKGLMAGIEKLYYIPEPHTDFIYAVIGEELGLIGTTGVLICFCVITWRGLRIAMRAEDMFGSLVALGLTTMVAVQAFINMSMVLGLMPTKGIPLPLVSNGGSSLLINLLGVGMLLNISQHEATDA